MAYFNELQTINYDFNIGTQVEIRKIRDITANIRFQKQMVDDITLFDMYDIKDGETPEMVSQRFYGSPDYHWIIMLLNDRYDVLNEWPLSTVQMDRYMRDTYGTGNYNLIHHYVNAAGRPITSTETYPDPYLLEDKIICSMNNADNTIKSSTINDFFTAMGRLTNSKIYVKGLGIPNDIQVYVLSFPDASTAILSNPVTMTQVTELTFVYSIDPLIGSTAVTNFDYESYVNESKRRIKILHPSKLQEVIQQFSTIIHG